VAEPLTTDAERQAGADYMNALFRQAVRRSSYTTGGAIGE